MRQTKAWERCGAALLQATSMSPLLAVPSALADTRRSKHRHPRPTELAATSARYRAKLADEHESVSIATRIASSSECTSYKGIAGSKSQSVS